jgi:hypothetical protein
MCSRVSVTLHQRDSQEAGSLELRVRCSETFHGHSPHSSRIPSADETGEYPDASYVNRAIRS